jgi:hypothetical protein
MTCSSAETDAPPTCSSRRYISTAKLREVARDARYALHSAQPWEDHAGEHGEFMVRGWLEQIPPSHPALTVRPGRTPCGLVHYACSIEEAVATEYSEDEMPVYRRWKPSSGEATASVATASEPPSRWTQMRVADVE